MSSSAFIASSYSSTSLSESISTGLKWQESQQSANWTNSNLQHPTHVSRFILFSVSYRDSVRLWTAPIPVSESLVEFDEFSGQPIHFWCRTGILVIAYMSFLMSWIVFVGEKLRSNDRSSATIWMRSWNCEGGGGGSTIITSSSSRPSSDKSVRKMLFSRDTLRFRSGDESLGLTTNFDQPLISWRQMGISVRFAISCLRSRTVLELWMGIRCTVLLNETLKIKSSGLSRDELGPAKNNKSNPEVNTHATSSWEFKFFRLRTNLVRRWNSDFPSSYHCNSYCYG